MSCVHTDPFWFVGALVAPRSTIVGRALRDVYFATGQRFGEARAREILAEAYRRVFGVEGSLNALQIAQGVSRGESYYGQATYRNLETGEEITDTNNWTAQQCGGMQPPCDPGVCFEATDTHADGTKYQACFRLFATPEEGAESFLRILYRSRPEVLAAADAGDVDLVAERMRESGYYELALDKYQKALNGNVDKVAATLGEPRATPRATPGVVTSTRRVWPWSVALSGAPVFRERWPTILALGAGALGLVVWRARAA